MPKPDAPLNYQPPQDDPFPALVLITITLAAVSLLAQALFALTALGPFASLRHTLRPIFGGGFILTILSLGASFGALRYRDSKSRPSLRSTLWLALTLSLAALAIAVLTMVLISD
jgi:hypothetical protein